MYYTIIFIYNFYILIIKKYNDIKTKHAITNNANNFAIQIRNVYNN